MSRFRTLIAGLAAAAIATPVLAQSCLPPVERSALDVQAIQSQLMVAALACDERDRYNAFINAHRAAMAAANRGVIAHFRRVHGAQAQRQQDIYITTLANAQSQLSLTRGTLFCREVVELFTRATQIDSATLPTLASAANLPNPISAPACGASGTQAAGAPARTAQGQQAGASPVR